MSKLDNQLQYHFWGFLGKSSLSPSQKEMRIEKAKESIKDLFNELIGENLSVIVEGDDNDDMFKRRGYNEALIELRQKVQEL